MIRKMSSNDMEVLRSYAKEEANFNQYILGYEHNYGYDKEFLCFWGEFDRSSRLKGILMKYYNDFVFYSKGNFDAEGFSKIILSNRFQVLAGKNDILGVFEKYIDFREKFDTFFCIQESCEGIQDEHLLSQVKKMNPVDLESVINLYDEIEEFENNEIDNTSLKQRISDGCGRGYYIEVQGEAAAAVQTTAEYEVGAMIVSVSTSPRHRRKGYVTTCLRKLCLELNKEDKKAFLYYYNEEAGRIYSKLGFKHIGMWTRYIK